MRILKGNLYAIIAKVIFVSLAMVALGYFMMAAFGTGDTNIAIFLAICILLLAFTYFTNLSVPLKFFAPGIMFLGAFVIVPVVFTLSMAGFKYQTGNMLSKEDALSTIIDQGNTTDPEGTSFDVVIGHVGEKQGNVGVLIPIPREDESQVGSALVFDSRLGYYGGDKSNIAVLVSDVYEEGSYPFFISTATELVTLTEDDVVLNDDYVAVKAPGVTQFSEAESKVVSDQLAGIRFKYVDPYFLKADPPIRGNSMASVNQAEVNYNYFISTKTEYYEVDESDVTVDDLGQAIAAKNFTKYTSDQIAKYADKIGNVRLKYEDPYYIGIENLPTGSNPFGWAIVKIQNITYDKKTDKVTDILTGATYSDDGRGNYRNPDNKEDYLDPGWRQGVWFENFTSLVTEPRIREPLISVFIWTIVFAVSTVITQFALGLLVAIAMDKKLRGRGVYRSLMILPYAMPSIMSILIWGGMLDRNGAINSLLNLDISWLQDPWMAKVSVLLVNLWLGFPYFYLICAGSLQAIPKELAESASIDGANARQIFRLITLPLLLRMLTPLLIASFAFNFNNFNIVYLLTGGGPKPELDSLAGATDILISYTYKLAFDTTIQNYGLASAISVVIFVIVASISMYGIRKSKVLDDFA